MLLFLYSDTNYARAGIRANITVGPLPCVQGVRNGSACACAAGWTGLRCDTALCPRNCSHALGQGECVVPGADPTSSYCRCVAGFAGPDCAAPITPDSWYTVRRDGGPALTPRMFHSLSVEPSTGHAWQVIRSLSIFLLCPSDPV